MFHQNGEVRFKSLYMRLENSYSTDGYSVLDFVLLNMKDRKLSIRAVSQNPCKAVTANPIFEVCRYNVGLIAMLKAFF